MVFAFVLGPGRKPVDGEARIPLCKSTHMSICMQVRQDATFMMEKRGRIQHYLTSSQYLNLLLKIHWFLQLHSNGYT